MFKKVLKALSNARYALQRAWFEVVLFFTPGIVLPLKTEQDLAIPAYRWFLLQRELVHFIGGMLAVFVQLAIYPDVWVSRVAAPATVVAAVGVAEFIHTIRGQQPWKGAVDLFVWGSAAILAAYVGL